MSRGTYSRRRFLQYGAGAGSLLALAACAPQATQPAGQTGGATAPATPKKGGTMVIAYSADVTQLVPATSTGHTTHRVLSFMHEGLVREDLFDTKSSSLKTIPWLAESWEVSPDGLQYTFKLRQNVKFHDGTPFDAEAVKANYDRCTNPNSPFFDETTRNLTAQIFNFVDRGEVVDRYTWRYVLKEPFGEFLRLLNDRLLLFISPTALRTYGNQRIADHPTGTGPFKFVERVPGQRIVMEANKEYWGGAPNLDRVIISIIVDPQARMAALQSGEIDLQLEMLPDQVEILRRDPNIEVTFQPIPHTWFWMLNFRDGPTSNKLVRQALNLAWNRDAMVKNLLKDLATPAVSPVPPNNPAHPPSRQPYTYNPDQARALLAQAGFPSGFEMTLMFPEATGGGQMQSVAMNSLLQADFRRIGVDLKLDRMEQTAFLTIARRGLPPTHGALQTNWTTNAQLGFWLEQMFTTALHPPAGNNRGWYSSEQADRLMREARTITDPARSAEAYRRVLDVIVEDAPWLWVVHDKNPIALRKRVRDLPIAATPYLDLQKVWLDG